MVQISKYLTLDPHVAENLCQIKLFPSVIRKPLKFIWLVF